MKFLVIADIHGNAEALKAVLEREQDSDSVIFLGDAVYPGPQAKATIDLLKSRKGVFIRGNHDEMALDRSALEGWPEPWQLLYNAIYSRLDPSYFEFFRELQDGGKYLIDDTEVCIQHGYVEGKVRHVLPNASDQLLKDVARGIDAPVTFFGHSHVQFRRKVDQREYINPGSVGQNRCGHVIACYGILQDGVFEHRSIPYDPQPLLNAIDEINELDSHSEFKSWLKSTIATGYGIGKQEPWTTFAAQGYT